MVKSLNFSFLQERRKTHEINLTKADTAYSILCQDIDFTGNFVIDDEHLAKHHGITDFSSYQCDPSVPESDLTLDFFLPSYTPEEVQFEGSNYFADSAQSGNQTQVDIK